MTGAEREKYIWSRLTAAGLTPAGAAGLMGNLYAESGLNPANLQNTHEKKLGLTDAAYTAAVDAGTYTNFAGDGAGYGLAQWTYKTRKAALLAYVRAAGRSVGDLEAQVGFLLQELAGSYKGVLSTLKSAQDVRTASDAVLLQFERPADQGEAARARRAGYGKTYFDRYAPADTSGLMPSGVFVDKLLAVAGNFKTLYIMGCFGAPMTPENKARYTKNHAYNTSADQKARINAASADTFGFDCVNLIKGILWGWSGDASKRYGGATYPTAAAFASGACPDVSADGMIKICKEVSTDFSRIVPGAAVWVKGHIGVYIGDGLAVECTPKWRNKVQVTAVSNIGTKAGYNARKWTKWGKIPYINYEEEIENMSKEELKALIRETVREVLDEENPVYKDLKDVPEYWKPTAAALLEAGAVNGGTPVEVCETDLNLRKETLKAVVVAATYHDAREGKQ